MRYVKNDFGRSVTKRSTGLGVRLVGSIGSTQMRRAIKAIFHYVTEIHHNAGNEHAKK